MISVLEARTEERRTWACCGACSRCQAAAKLPGKTLSLWFSDVSKEKSSFTCGNICAVGHLTLFCQVEEDERLQPFPGQHLRLQRTCEWRLHGAPASGRHAHRAMVHGSRGPEGERQRERGAGDPLPASRCTWMTFFSWAHLWWRSVLSSASVPPGPGPYPGILDMWGGGGGLIEYRSALLASRGYISLALEYLKPDELQSVELAISYFEVCFHFMETFNVKKYIFFQRLMVSASAQTAFNIIKGHPRVIPDRIGLFGLSLGSIVTFSLAAGSTVVKARLVLKVHQCCVWIQM